jgi:SAM-dependent methyltransferase
VLDALVKLFERRAEIPGDDELPRVHPKLERYVFPADVLSDERMRTSLAAHRLAGIRGAVGALEAGRPGDIRYWAPATVEDLRSEIGDGSIDMILSQAVMQYVSNLPAAYGAMHHLLRPGGVISHQVDFGAHQTCPEWDGHWRYSDRQWRLVRGRRAHFLNREPLSAHLDALGVAGFDLLGLHKVKACPTTSQPVPRRVRSSEEDRTIRSALIVARRPG